MKKENISDAVIRRLPRYYRQLTDLYHRGIVRTSSHSLGQEMNITASQIRQDFSCFGEFGQQGYGYNVEELRSEIGHILGVDNDHHLIMIGVGNLGRAVASYAGLVPRGFEVVALVDVAPEVVGTTVAGVEVADLAELSRLVVERDVALAVLTVPGGAAQDALDAVAASGVRSVLSFAPRALLVPDGVALRSVDVAAELQILSYYLPPV